MLRILRVGKTLSRSGGSSTSSQELCSGCPYLNVLDFGADPTGSLDSTGAFIAASAAGLGRTIWLPYTDSGGTYLVDSDSGITWASREWLGDLVDDVLRTRIVASGSGTALINSSSPAKFENIDIDANGLSDYALFGDPGTGIYVKNCILRNANVHGFRIEEGACVFELVTIQDCAAGMYLLAPNGSMFFDVSVKDCVGRGVEHIGLFAGGTAQSGAVNWYGGNITNNGNTEQLLISGVQGAVFSGLHIEGATDGVRLTSNAENILFDGMVLIGPETKVAFNLEDFGYMNTIKSCHASGDDYARCSFSSNRQAEVTIFGSKGQFGTSTLRDIRTYIVDGTNPFEADHHASGALVSDAAPLVGIWRAGDVVINNGGGGVVGWICTIAGNPGTWVSF